MRSRTLFPTLAFALLLAPACTSASKGPAAPDYSATLSVYGTSVHALVIWTDADQHVHKEYRDLSSGPFLKTIRLPGPGDLRVEGGTARKDGTVACSIEQPRSKKFLADIPGTPWNRMPTQDIAICRRHLG